MAQYLSEESFAALIYFEFDFQTMILTIISAVLIFSVKPQVNELIPVFSCYLGLLDYADIQILKMPFQAGQIYGMMSDGVSDLMEPSWFG